MSDLKINLQQPQISSAKLEQIKNLSPQEKAEKEKLEKAARDFEGFFLDIVMKSMRDTVPDSDIMGGNGESKFFQSMLDTEYAKVIGKRGDIGLSSAIIRQLSPNLKDGA